MSGVADSATSVDAMKNLLQEAQEENKVSDRSLTLLRRDCASDWTREDVAAHIISFCSYTKDARTRNLMRRVLFDMLHSKNKKGKTAVVEMKRVTPLRPHASNKSYALGKKVLRGEIAVDEAIKAAKK